MGSTRNRVLVGVLAALALTITACSSGEEATDGGGASEQTETTEDMGSEDMGSEDMDSDMGSEAGAGVTTPEDTFGPACADLPQGDEPGSLDSMGPQPVADAAGTNPVLTQLVTAVGAVPGLGDTLNGAEALTVFAPADAAFEELGEEAFNELAADPEALGEILSYHVVGERMDADGIAEAGTLPTLQGGELTIEGEGEDLTVNGAAVACGNIPTANATVFVIDTVLTPES
ncbi:fasciclin domain-containing protein [Actinoalloteichus hymeniacidonis]|uniref:Secreted/surface protein with fasciclin-like repeats n=1 Tax=Actinoalloteichus hymeniacidonis TaxID=340345 RepID=A0AAC9HL11_9PSEU|nr:fasciclin domain-containing protein [Actinoalloteichus hymeniacidonis]AOS61312.1 secreted/surface protein with fasciclin-like repeats [Actinoalloteichus hymeniacidonis]MBB5910683.1 putative surface protein with fasciclin (FAS1) repeats [Actinoalloteichus hymeniacidonis]